MESDFTKMLQEELESGKCVSGEDLLRYIFQLSRVLDKVLEDIVVIKEKISI